GASIVSFGALIMGLFLVPQASEGFNNFRYMYLIGHGRNQMRESSDIYRQISNDEFIYAGSFNQESQMAFNFSMEKFKNDKLQYKVAAERITFNPKDSTYTLYNYTKRKVGDLGDIIETKPVKDTVFNFELEDLTPTVYVAETLSMSELTKFIDKEKSRGSSNI